jgi:mono/diheme cytochrome c family protein
MAQVQLLGLLHEATPTADTIAQLRQLGVPDEKITVMSSMPYRAEMLGRRRARSSVGRIALLGGVLGLLTGLFLSVGIFLLYPLSQGGQPIVPIPPSLIVLFELTMLGTMWATFFGLLVVNKFPTFKPQLYDPRITEGHIGVLAEVDEALADQVENVLVANGAHHLHRQEVSIAQPRSPRTRGSRDQPADPRFKLFWGSSAALVALLAAIVLLIAYDILKISFPSNMVNQDSTAYEQGPRLAAPAEAVPIQGPVLIAGQPATAPIPATANSLQRGQALFNINCAVCHGPEGKGNGPLSGFFSPKPADLTGDGVQSLSNDELFLIITQGRGLMPSLAENLSAGERWDVINHVRTLKK